MINKVTLQDGYSVTVENDSVTQKTQLGIEDWQLMFTSKQEVVAHIAMLNKALEFWEYDGE